MNGRAAAAALAALLLTAAAPLAAQSIHFASRLSVGALEGSDREVFEVVKDVSAGPERSFAVLDAQSQAVKLFSPAGSFLQQLGRAGRGPGEFFVPVALDHDRRGNLYVLDVANQRVEVFARRPDGLRHARGFRIDFAAYDMCVLGGELFLHGYRGGAVVHAYTPEGRRVRSFGTPLYPDHPYLRVSSSRGLLECVEEAEAVLLLPMLSPVLRAFAASGREMWSRTIPRYEPVVIRASPTGASYTFGPAGWHHMASSLVRLDSGSVIVQVGVIGTGAKKPEEFREVTSFLVSVSDGRLRPMSAGTPRLLELRDGLGYSVRSDPYPAVTVFGVEISPGERR